jgi:type VI secretion system protein ImpC
MFAISRFSHYLKVMVRDWIGESYEKDELQRRLQEWINQYVLPDASTAGEISKAKKPLSEARVDVFADEENPGYYGARFYLRPHFQLEGMDIGMSLVSRLPGKAA